MSPIYSALFGVAIGDALGVPVEFRDREKIKQNPVTDMMGYGTHHQPAGTFSDDASLTFCLAEALVNGYDINKIAHNFILWLNNGFWGAHDEVFDIGIATRQAIENVARGINPEKAGGIQVFSNGNGSLMRILPLLFYIKDKPVEERFEITRQVSSITHGHIRSVIGCFYYLEFARHLLQGVTDLLSVYELLKIEINTFFKNQGIAEDEIAVFDRLLKGDIYKCKEEEIESTGYVVHTLEAAIWCLMTTSNYRDAVLKAVNLGYDTDTTGAVTGGLAGLLYGYETIPKQWIATVAKKEAIELLCEKLGQGLIIHSADFIATLKYKTVEEGGRTTPAKSGYRPTIRFSFDKMLTSGIQYFIGKEWVYPGEKVDANINILAVPYFIGCLDEGMEFVFTEGPRIIGTGMITKIVNEKLRK